MLNALAESWSCAMRLTTEMNKIWSKRIDGGEKNFLQRKWSRSTEREILIQLHVAGDRYRAVYLVCCTACQQRKVFYILLHSTYTRKVWITVTSQHSLMV